MYVIFPLSGSIQTGQARQNSLQSGFLAVDPQVPPTPPPTLISNRCPAYTAPTVPAPLRIRYVDATNGNDANDGTTPATAWRTIHPKANSEAQAGDLILLRGVFLNQWLKPNASGTAANKITFRKEPGQIAVLDTGLYEGGVILDGNSHIVVDGLEIRNISESVRVAYGGHDNWLRNLYIHNGGHVTFRFDADNNRLEDSILVDIGSDQYNSGDAVDLLGDADNNIVVRNYFGNAGHAAYDDTLQGDSTGFNENNILAQNIIDNQWSSNVIIGGRSIGTLIECNVIKNASQATKFNYPRMGIQLSGDNSIIRYNYIYNNKSYGFLVQGYVYAGQEQFPENNQLYHNTVVNNGSAGLFIAVSGNGYVRNNTFENNIFWNNFGYDGANGNRYDVVADFYQGTNPWNPATGFTDGNIFKYNNVSADPTKFLVVVRPGGVGNLYYDTPEQAQAAFSTWTNNTRVNPLFTNPAANDYSLQAGSPMIDTGRIIPGVIYNGSAPDRGAFEYGGTPQTQTPYPGPTPNAPTVIEAENFDNGGQGVAYNENFGITGSGVYRSNPVEAVDIQARATASNGYAVFEAAAGEWLEYTVNIPVTRKYNIGVKYSSEFNNGKFRIEDCGSDPNNNNCTDITGLFTANSTGSWGTFQTLTKLSLQPLSAGTHILRLVMVTNSPDSCGCVVANFDAIQIKTPQLADFDGDTKTDISVFRLSNATWYLQRSELGFHAAQFGVSTDKIAPADFDGDGKTDISVFRIENGIGYWYRLNSSNGQFVIVQFGNSEDKPVSGDFDGDGKADIAVFRTTTGVWYITRSSDSVVVTQYFGANGDIPLIADFDGDGRNDFAVFRPSNTIWHIQQTTSGFKQAQFGLSTDKLTPADFDGDGKTDYGVFRPSDGYWYTAPISEPNPSQNFTAIPWGANGDIPSPSDYDGDGKYDRAVYRPNDGAWYVLRSADLSNYSVLFGISSDIPIPSTYIPQ